MLRGAGGGAGKIVIMRDNIPVLARSIVLYLFKRKLSPCNSLMFYDVILDRDPISGIQVHVYLESSFGLNPSPKFKTCFTDF